MHSREPNPEDYGAYLSRGSLWCWDTEEEESAFRAAYEAYWAQASDPPKRGKPA